MPKCHIKVHTLPHASRCVALIFELFLFLISSTHLTSLFLFLLNSSFLCCCYPRIDFVFCRRANRIITDYSTVYFMAFSLHTLRYIHIAAHLCSDLLNWQRHRRYRHTYRTHHNRAISEAFFLFTFHATQFYWQFGSIVCGMKCV